MRNWKDDKYANMNNFSHANFRVIHYFPARLSIVVGLQKFHIAYFSVWKSDTDDSLKKLFWIHFQRKLYTHVFINKNIFSLFCSDSGVNTIVNSHRYIIRYLQSNMNNYIFFVSKIKSISNIGRCFRFTKICCK